MAGKANRLIGWQGFTLNVPESWDLTGFSGKETEGYVRIDDSDEQAVEIKWATEKSKSKTVIAPTDVEARRTTFFESLRKRAKKEKLTLETRPVETYRPVQRPERVVAAFNWTADRKGIGAVWHCQTCRRTVIAQVLGARSGRGGLSSAADAVLATLRCHSDEPGWRTWALYDLVTELPENYVLESQQLMNVYMRLSFTAGKTTRLSVEQWSLANVARRDAYLDAWLAANAKGEMREARYTATEREPVRGHAALSLVGGLAVGMPMINAIRQATRLQWPATRFRAAAWECEPSNKLYLVESLRPSRRGTADDLDAVVARTRCHDGAMSGVSGERTV
jgi:hypothetical protein